MEVDANSPVHRQLYERYLTERHGDLVKARAWLGLAADAPLVPAAGDGSWGDLKAVAFEEFRTWLLQRWVRENVAGLKEGNPKVPVTVGYLQSRHPADKIDGQKGLDFANMHSYDASRAFYTSFRFIDRRPYGQGLTLGEFGARTLHELRVRGGDGEAGDADRRLFNTTVGLAFGAGGSMALNWCFRGLPDVVFPWELFRSDRVGRPPLADFAALTLATRGVKPTYQPPAAYLLVPDSNRLGPRYGDIDNALARSIETLHSLHVPFALLHERDLRLPAEAKALFWPVPYCPSDAAFAKVEAWVKAGGRLYLSGDVSFDEQRHGTRGDRLTRLGLAATTGRDPFGANDANAASVTVKAGAGAVTFVPSPVEMSAPGRLPELYAAFAKEAGIARWAVTPDVAEVQVGSVLSLDGSTAWVAASWGQERDVTVGGVRLKVARDDLGLVHVGADGAVRTVYAQGDVAGIASADGPFMALSGSTVDLRASASLVVAPLGAKSLALTTRRAWQAPTASVGEVRGGRWHELAKLPVRADGGQVKLTLGEDYLNTYVVVAEPAALAAAEQALVGAVLMR
ncbi:MAG: hypothetical protein HZB16_24625 [Armatimonadetes bacterium]|nr:hypothetical protein [Armatimonadota bacterium]